ncbi:MAG: hypothetical protein CVU62_12380 [Deltaproteobacteria bacterium HGW-Deltaproteobacteria-2]|jgi:uncharacterized repeat protein (TIGR01451 family)|nr:MAG: hypothetical protein CVU62_12380 [Deltaproteobacteria bacterium HGW-Deltaproteobacteria-2]
MRKLFLTIVAMLFMAVIAAPPVMAAGTVAGTAITNQAYGDYKDANGNDMTRVYSNTVSMTVSQVAAVAVDPPTGSQAVKHGDVIYYLVQLFNHGNGPDSQTFSYVSSGDWNPTQVRMFYDINNNHVYDAGDILLTETSPGSKTYKTVTTGGAAVLIAPDDDYDVLIEVTVPPSGLLDSQYNTITITTASDFDPTKTATGTYTSTVQAATISMVKSHTPTGNPTYVKPGDEITYTVAMTNTGTGDALAINAEDILPTNVTFKPGSIEIKAPGDADFSPRNDACNDGPDPCYDSANHRIRIPGNSDPSPYNLPGGHNYTYYVRIKVTVNAGVPSGTAITNQASATYSTGSYTASVQSNGDTVLVATLAGIDLSTTATNKTGNPSDQIVYPFMATNNGNADDKINLTTASTSGWTWVIWYDVDGNGIPGTDGDVVLTDTNADGIIDTGTLVQYGHIDLLAVVTIPPGTANGSTDVLTISGVSVFDPTKTDVLSFTTTVKAPVLSMTKAITAVGAPGGGATCTPTDGTNGSPCILVPGSVITYQVTTTNSGNGTATALVITDLIPAHTTYVAGSIKTGATTSSLTLRTDATDGDGGRYDSGSNAVIVGGSGNLNLGATGTWVVEFKVTVN